MFHSSFPLNSLFWTIQKYLVSFNLFDAFWQKRIGNNAPRERNVLKALEKNGMVQPLGIQIPNLPDRPGEKKAMTISSGLNSSNQFQ